MGGIKLAILPDSGSNSNVVDVTTWELLKAKHIVCKSSRAPINKQIYSYTSEKPLKVKGTFVCEVKAGSHRATAEFVVVEGKGIPLLSRKTSQQLGLMKIGIDVAALSESVDSIHKMEAQLLLEDKDTLSGVGKLKAHQVKLRTDPKVPPVAQPVRRTPFVLREKVEQKVKELVEADIIEKVEEPTEWVSPVVIVPKANDDIRICVDMRRVNQAVMRERHPIPTIDEMLSEMSNSKVFSKLDLKWGYHQLELHPDSRNLTTFITHCGLYRYKRLLFGINAASEIFQNEVRKVIQGIPGVANKSDDIIVHTKTVEEHDESLRQVMERLKKAGLTLNWVKCQFFKSNLTFDGHQLSCHGINPTEDKVKAILEACAPENISEVRSFLGLVNYCSRYIPDLATKAEPLRRLTRKNQPFVFGAKEQKSFETLKLQLGRAETLAYFDVKARTQVIADASPYGLGGILVQIQKGEPRIVTYASRSLSEVERRYSQTEKEALALVWACEKFHSYIYGLKFDLITDHKPLEAIYTPKSKPCACIEHWVLRL